ncbi:hypothetical protein BT69DRAFT_1242432 [Atractiella rhizophila]|nr:hypothetical protein BT69DRAFT_1242432 [Atractiella rhizophila]
MSLSRPFSLVPPTPTLERLIRVLSTWGGTDRFFMVIQYSTTLLLWVLKNSLKVQSGPKLVNLEKLLGEISQARMLYRIWGVLPILTWLQALEKPGYKPTSKLNHWIERAQGYSMLAYYPLEHTYFLGSKGLISLTPAQQGRAGIWSVRFWALYVFLQFAHLYEDLRLLKLRKRAVDALDSPALSADEREGKEYLEVARTEKGDKRKKIAAIEQQERGLWDDFIVNVGYAPLTVHWSLESGLFQPGSPWVAIFGTIAGLYSWKQAWAKAA